MDALRAVGILMVVGIHTTGYVVLEGVTQHWVGFVVYTISVPAFFLCDGYLLAHKARVSTGYTATVASAARRLLAPWLIFSAVYTAARAMFEGLDVLDERIVLDQSAGVVLRRIYGSEIAPQLYFLLSLFIIRCGVPLWRRVVAAPIALHLALFLVSAAAHRYFAPELRQIFSIGTDPILHAIWGLQFYIAGSCLCRLRVSIGEADFALALASGILLVALLATDAGPQWALQYAYLLCAFFSFAALPRIPRPLVAVGKDTMGIYLLHAPVLLKACTVAVLSVLSQSLASYLIVTFTVFGLAWVATRMLMSLRYGPILFGVFANRRI